jgi:dienelactone hydrolase
MFPLIWRILLLALTVGAGGIGQIETPLLAQAVTGQASGASELPRPTGPYAVGTYSLTLTDPTRREIFTQAAQDARRVPVQVYYPAAASCSPAPFFPAALANVFAGEMQLTPGFERRMLGHACRNASVARTAGRLPVILFSHGLQFTHFSYTSILEELASQGYIVVAIDHSYGSRATYFPDAPLVLWDNSRWRRNEDEARYRAARGEYYRFWAEDARQVLDRIFAPNDPVLSRALRRRANLEKLAYLGHSYGGLAAIYAAQRDHRIKGAVNMDGGLVERIDGAVQPRMLLPATADVPLLVLNSAPNIEAEFYGSGVRVARIGRSQHMSFSDVVWLFERARAPAQQQPQETLSGEQGIALTREVLNLYLDCLFKNACLRLDEKLAAIGMVAPSKPSGS